MQLDRIFFHKNLIFEQEKFLPDEINLIIISLLAKLKNGENEILRLSCVCKSYRILCEDHRIWSIVVKRLNISEKFLNPVDRLAIFYLKKNPYLDYWSCEELYVNQLTDLKKIANIYKSSTCQTLSLKYAELLAKHGDRKALLYLANQVYKKSDISLPTTSTEEEDVINYFKTIEALDQNNYHLLRQQPICRSHIEVDDPQFKDGSIYFRLFQLHKLALKNPLATYYIGLLYSRGLKILIDGEIKIILNALLTKARFFLKQALLAKVTQARYPLIELSIPSYSKKILEQIENENNSDNFYELGKHYYSLFIRITSYRDSHSESLSYFKKAVGFLKDASAKTIEANFFLGNLLKSHRLREYAIEYYRKGAEAGDQRCFLEWGLTLCSFEQADYFLEDIFSKIINYNRFYEAIDVWESVTSPDYLPEALWNLSQLFIEIEEYAEAFECLTKIIKVDSRDIGHIILAYEELAKMYRENWEFVTQDLIIAEKYECEAKNLRDSNQKITIVRGKVIEFLDFLNIDQQIDEESEDNDFFSLGVHYYELFRQNYSNNDGAKAVWYLKEASDLNLNEANFYLGNLLKIKFLRQDAIEYYQKGAEGGDQRCFLELGSTLSSFSSSRGYSFSIAAEMILNSDCHNQAIIAWNSVTNPDYLPEALWNIACLYLDLDNYKEALEYFKKITEISDSKDISHIIMANLKLAEIYSGNIENGYEDWQSVTHDFSLAKKYISQARNLSLTASETNFNREKLMALWEKLHKQ